MLHLGALVDLPSDRGRVELRGPWGSRLGQFGLYRPSRTGPTSFDVTPTGGIVVVDQQNHRVVVHEAGRDRAVVSGIRAIYYDIAAADDAFHLLAINGGAGGDDVLRVFSVSDGSLVRSTSVGADATAIRVVAGDQYVRSLSGAWRVVGDDSPGLPEMPTEDGGRILLGGGRGRSVTITTSDATGSASWRLTSPENLGVVAVTASPRGVRAVLVRWTDTSRAYQYVELGPDGVHETFTMPDQHFAEMTAGAEFRFHGDSLYRAASTRQGFGIYRYEG